MLSEHSLLALSLVLYSFAALLALWDGVRSSEPTNRPVVVLVLALSIHTVMIALRWKAMGHGPYVNLYEILNSNIWSAHVAVLIAWLALPSVRPSLATCLPLLQMLVLWLWIVPASETIAPVTYATIWLGFHVWIGKIFFGCLVVATGLALLVILRRRWSSFGGPSLAETDLDSLAFRIIGFAFLFETMMLVVGAIWAQDAWGRYWDWDPLETWSFATWIMLAAFLHLRASNRLSPALSSLAIIGIFVLAFATFFGVPFLSTAPHKGAI